LYINGRFTKSLDEDEQVEMGEYRKALDRFKTDVKQFVEQQQKQFQLADSEVKSALLQSKKQPEPPKRVGPKRGSSSFAEFPQFLAKFLF
jgi:hypothetical protein